MVASFEVRNPLRRWAAGLTLALMCLAMLAPQPALGQSSALPSARSDTPTATSQQTEVDADRLVALIKQLGAATFSERERASQELRSVGVSAFSLLRAYRNAEDPEIRLRVRKLAADLLPQMIRRGVPKVESSLIADYLQLEETHRRHRILTISQSLMPEFGGVVLLRIAQLETESTLAKMAAAGLLGGGFPTDWSQREFLRQQLHVPRDATASEEHPGLIWIREFRRSLDDPQRSFHVFETFADDEQAVLRQNPLATDELTIIWPLRCYSLDLRVAAGLAEAAANYAAELFRRAESESLARRTLLVTMFQRKYYDLLLKLGEDNDEWFASHRFAQYLRAAAAEARGDAELAGRLAEAAFAAAENEDADRIDTALLLRTLGINHWCEREYRAVFQRPHAQMATASFEARRLLADILHQQERDREAAEIMKQAVDLCQEDETGRAEENLEEVRLATATLPQFHADMHFFLALAARQAGDTEGEIGHFREAFAISKENSDALCEAYKVEHEAWQAELRKIVSETLEELLQQHARSELQLLRQPNETRYRHFIASLDNEIAWILVNTGGNLKDALRYAQQSVEYRPGMGYSIDTLATCHFALEEIDRAIEYERMALRLNPHREDIARTLQRFIAGKAAKGER
jgi:tetratricopeptide (TPR) repeat protein